MIQRRSRGLLDIGAPVEDGDATLWPQDAGRLSQDGVAIVDLVPDVRRRTPGRCSRLAASCAPASPSTRATAGPFSSRTLSFSSISGCTSTAKTRPPGATARAIGSAKFRSGPHVCDPHPRPQAKPLEDGRARQPLLPVGVIEQVGVLVPEHFVRVGCMPASTAAARSQGSLAWILPPIDRSFDPEGAAQAALRRLATRMVTLARGRA